MASRTAASSRRTARGVAEPIVSARMTTSLPARAAAAACSATRPGSTSPSNGQPSAAASVTEARRPAAQGLGDDFVGDRGRRAGVRALVASRELVGDRIGRVNLLRRGGERTPKAVRVEHEQREPAGLDSATDRAVDDLLDVRHLRHAVGANRAPGLDERRTGVEQACDELRAHRRCQRDLLVLQPVAWPDVAERHPLAHGVGADSTIPQSMAEPSGRAVRRPGRAASPARRPAAASPSRCKRPDP